MINDDNISLNDVNLETNISDDMIKDMKSQIHDIDHTNVFDITKQLVVSAEKIDKLSGTDKKNLVLKALKLAQDDITNNHIKSAVEFLIDNSISKGIDTIVSIYNEQKVLQQPNINKKIKFQCCCFMSESN